MAIGTSLSRKLADFGTRSLLTHAIMAVGFAGAIISGLFISGQAGVISMVAFINFTAGIWISQSIHSLGNSARDEDYEGVLKEVLDYV